MSYRQRAATAINACQTVRSSQATMIDELANCWWQSVQTSWMFGSSSSSEKTKTPGAAVASWISLVAAAPLTDLAMRRNGSSFAPKLDPKSMVDVDVERGESITSAHQSFCLVENLTFWGCSIRWTWLGIRIKMWRLPSSGQLADVPIASFPPQ